MAWSAMAAWAIGIVCASCWLAGLLFFLRGRGNAGMASAMLGNFLGLLLGLSESPILSAVLLGILTLIGQVAGAVASAKHKTSIDVVPPANIILPFAVFAMAGALGGILLRANDALSLGPRDLKTRCAQLGFDDMQTAAIMARLATGVELSDVVTHTSGNTSLLTQNSDFAGIWLLATQNDWSPSQTVQAFAAMFPDAAQEVESLRKSGNTDEQILESLKGKYK